MIPTLVAPTYEIKLISQPKPIKYRPYLVKEEKILLMAQEGNDSKEIEAAVKQIITNCTFGELDPEELPAFDLEYLFLMLRARSVNNIIELRYICKNVPVKPNAELPLEEPKVCGRPETITINLDTLSVTVPENHVKKVMITDTLGCIMRYPTSRMLGTFNGTSVVDSLDLISGCIETIFQTTGETYEAKEADPGEMRTFVESLSLQQAEQFRTFFETLPNLSYTFEFKCSSCGYTETITLSGLLDFFV